MSVIIKGGQMPKYCGECDGCRFDNLNVENRCFATGEFLDELDIYKERGKYCPLVEVPPHGRLIDASEMAIKFNCLDIDITTVKKLHGLLMEIPTVI